MGILRDAGFPPSYRISPYPPYQRIEEEVAILTGFPASNTISPGRHFSDSDPPPGQEKAPRGVEVYVSTDVETDGKIPGLSSMLSLGAAAFLADGTMLGTFQRNLLTLDGAQGDPDTMEWWSKQGEAWDAIRKNPQNPSDVMLEYVAWVEGLGGKPVFVSYPACFDFLFTYWYMIRFAGRSPFSHSGLDIKTYAMAVMGTPYRESTKKNMPKRWFGQHLHTHVPVDDAIEQGQLFINMLKEHRAASR